MRKYSVNISKGKFIYTTEVGSFLPPLNPISVKYSSRIEIPDFLKFMPIYKQLLRSNYNLGQNQVLQ